MWSKRSATKETLAERSGARTAYSHRKNGLFAQEEWLLMTDWVKKQQFFLEIKAKRTEKDLRVWAFCPIFAAETKKSAQNVASFNRLKMLHLSSKMPIFAPSFRKEWRHRGELLSFDPPENLQNSMYRVLRF